MQEFCLKMIIREDFRTRVECGKFRRLSYVRTLFTYISKTVSKLIHWVHVGAEHCLPKRFRGVNLPLPPMHEILAKVPLEVLIDKALKNVLVVVKATVLLQ